MPSPPPVDTEPATISFSVTIKVHVPVVRHLNEQTSSRKGILPEDRHSKETGTYRCPAAKVLKKRAFHPAGRSLSMPRRKEAAPRRRSTGEAGDQELLHPVQDLVTMCVHEKDVRCFAASRKGPWAMSNMKPLKVAMPNASLSSWGSFASSPSIGSLARFHEPPHTTPYVRWR